MAARRWHPSAEAGPPNAAETGHRGDEPPPVLKSWGRIYVLVLIELVVLVALFYWFTKTFE